MGTTIFVQTEQTTFEVWPCPNCGVRFAVTEKFADARRKDCRTIYCPNGHTMSYSESEADRERKKRQRAEEKATRLQAEADQARADAEHQRNVANGYKGALVKTKKRIGRGVCPCCNRHFADVERHMASKHPEVLGGEA